MNTCNHGLFHQPEFAMCAGITLYKLFGLLKRNSLGLFSHLDYSVKVQGVLHSNLSTCKNTLGLLASEL